MQYRDFADLIRPKTSNIVFCFVLVVLMWLFSFYSQDYSISAENFVFGDSPLSCFFDDSIDFSSLPFLCLSLSLLFLMSFFMVWINEIFSFISTRTILPAFFFLTIYSLLLRPYCFSFSLVAVILLFLILLLSFRLCEGSAGDPPLTLFNIGILLGGIVLISLSCLFFVPLLFIFFYQVKALNLKTFLAFVLGFSIPCLYAFGFFYWTENVTCLSDYLNQWSLNAGNIWSQMSDSMLLYLIILLGITVFSIVKIFLYRNHQTIKNREESMFIIYCFLLSLLILFLSPSDIWLMIPISCFFSAFILGQAFSSDYNLTNKIVGALFLISSVLFYLFPLFNWI